MPDAATATRLVSGAAPSPFYFDASVDLLDETATGSKLYRCIRVNYDDNENGVLNNSASSCLAPKRVQDSWRYRKGNQAGDVGASPACDSGSLISTDNTIEVTQLHPRLYIGEQSVRAPGHPAQYIGSLQGQHGVDVELAAGYQAA